MYRTFFLTLSRSEAFKKLLVTLPWTKKVVRHFVAGDAWTDARSAIDTLIDKGLKATVDSLGEGVHTAMQAETTVSEYLSILDHIQQEGWESDVEVSVKLTAIGLLLSDGEQLAVDNATRIASKAHEIGTTITIDMEDLPTTAKTIRVVQAVREQYPSVGCVLQANLKRTEMDCKAMDAPGSRVRLCKGAYRVPIEAAYMDKHDVNLSYVRCLKILMEGEGIPLVATHDPVMIEIAQELAAHSNRGLKNFEFQMLYGIRTVEQERLADLGHIVRVYVPYGRDWYGYFVRRLAERPANLLFFLRAVIGMR